MPTPPNADHSIDAAHGPAHHDGSSTHDESRRRFLKLGGASLGAAAAVGTAAAGALGGTGLAFADPADPSRGDLVVLVYLMGGADGLTLVPPHGEGRYYDRRPSLSVAPPGQGGGAIDLDGFFGMNPALGALHDGPFAAGHLAVIQATGFGENHPSLRSHFAAQGFSQRGSSDPAVLSGWLARYVHHAGLRSGVPAVSVSGGRLDESLGGFDQAYGVSTVDRFILDGFGGSGAERAAVRQAFTSAYGGHEAPLGRAGTATLDAVLHVENSGAAAIATANGATYPGSSLGRALADVARLARADLGLQVATISTGAWDTHDGQAGSIGGLMTNLGDSLAAFYADLGPLADEVTVIVDSEFGRTTEENGSGGTDHGKAGAMMVMGRSVRGGVYADWPTLTDSDGEPDLRVTRDYRSVLTEVLGARGNPAALDRVFPGFTAQAPLGLFT
ncbi:MAG: DUF1501 domain-containing protein [Actinomycetota bacterium]